MLYLHFFLVFKNNLEPEGGLVQNGYVGPKRDVKRDGIGCPEPLDMSREIR